MKTKQKKAKAVAAGSPQEDLIKSVAQLMLVTLVTIQQSISDCMNTINQTIESSEKKAK